MPNKIDAGRTFSTAVIGEHSLRGPATRPQPPKHHRSHHATRASSFTVATINDDFGTRRSNLPRVRADVMLVQEAKNENVRRLLRGRGVGVHQNTRRQDQQGTAVVWSRKVARAVDGGYAMGVRPHGRAMLNRWINWEDVVIDGTKVRMVSVHRPPARFKALWPLFDRNLARFVRHSRVPMVIGMDANQVNPHALAKGTGLRWHAPAGSIDGFLVSPGIKVEDLRRLPRATSDHHPVIARFTIKKRS